MTAITCLPVPGPVPGPGMAPPVARALPAGVYRRRRTVVATAVALMVFALAMLGGELLGQVSGTPGATPAGAAGEPVVYVVQPGDTLWEIARRLSPPGRDLRYIVDRLAADSGGPLLQPGQRIILPVDL